jgi:hypothetical protein
VGRLLYSFARPENFAGNIGIFVSVQRSKKARCGMELGESGDGLGTLNLAASMF